QHFPELDSIAVAGAGEGFPVRRKGDVDEVAAGVPGELSQLVSGRRIPQMNGDVRAADRGEILAVRRESDCASTLVAKISEFLARGNVPDTNLPIHRCERLAIRRHRNGGLAGGRLPEGLDLAPGAHAPETERIRLATGHQRVAVRHPGEGL